MNKESWKILNLKCNQGFSLIDSLVGVSLLLITVMYISRVELNSKHQLSGLDIETAKVIILENLNSALISPLAWKHTYTNIENQQLREHLTISETDPDSESAMVEDNLDGPLPLGQTVELYGPIFEERDRPILHKNGSRFLANGTMARTPEELSRAIFEARAYWYRGRNHTAIIEIRVSYLGKLNSPTSSLVAPNNIAKLRDDVFSRVYKPALRARNCIEGTLTDFASQPPEYQRMVAPIVAGCSGYHNNYCPNTIAEFDYMETDPGNNNFVWDHATVQCPINYYMVLVYAVPGCNAMANREYAFVNNARMGSCHQISAQTPEQIDSCAPGSNNGLCIARCCAFE